MKNLLKLLPVLAIAAMGFASCNNCCEADGYEVCKEDYEGDWDALVDSCDDTPGCSCS